PRPQQRRARRPAHHRLRDELNGGSMTNPRDPINPRLPASAAAMYTPWTQPVRTPTATRTPQSVIRSQQRLRLTGFARS
ncbi:MAG TPA: hypothetical protein VFD61_04995, partial [Gaiellales bacterium]|nr:hypothetical protein [Gaiellales bacterium]